MNKHTPGPWVRDDGGGLKGDVRAASGKWIALCWGIGNAKNPYREEYKAVCDANARLIAAAPELLEALEQTQIFLEMLGLRSSDEYQANAAAIAKAK